MRDWGRRSLVRRLSFHVVLAFASTHGAMGQDLSFTFDPVLSQLVFAGKAELAGAQFPLQPQFDGSLRTAPIGQVALQGSPLNEVFVPENLLQLNDLTQDARPAPGASPGEAPAQLAGIVRSNTSVRLPLYEGLDLGTLRSVNLDGALRDSRIAIGANTPIQVTEGAFNAAEVLGIFSGSFDVRGTVRLQAPNLAAFIAEDIALAALQEASNSPIESYTSSFSSRNFDLVLRTTILVNEDITPSPSSTGKFSVAHRAWRMELPFSFKASEIDQDLLLAMELTASGTLVAFTDEVLLEGDGNGDGTVNIRDFQLLRNHFNRNEPASDYDGSGLVDLADFSALRRNFGRSSSLAIPSPEPSSPCMAAAFWLCLVGVRRSRSKRG